MTPEKLISMAVEAMGKAYAPYSGFRVGAALLCSDGTVYTGCNTAIAVCGGKNGIITNLCTPCGVCRQVLQEFCKDDFPVYLAHKDGFKALTLGDLLPYSFVCHRIAP